MKKYYCFALLTVVFCYLGCTPCCVEKKEPQADTSASVAATEQADASQESSSLLTPTLFAKLDANLYNPDGLTVCEKTGRIFLNVPNFNQQDENGKKKDSHQGGYLVELFKDGTFKTLLEYPIYEPTGQTGPMGLDFGPDGHLYVCDNQYFYNKDFQSRVLRVLMKDGVPTGKVQSVIEGAKLSNAILWYKDRLFYTDTILDPDAKELEGTNFIGSGAVFMFDKDEVLKAGTEGNPAIKVKPAKEDSHCLSYEMVTKVGRGEVAGIDGMTVDTNTDVLYFGNFGNGHMYAVYPEADGSYKKDSAVTIYDPLKATPTDGFPLFDCCDGIFYDSVTNNIFINDSSCNAIRYFTPVAKGQMADIKVLAINEDTDGNDGSLDQPCECVVVDGKMIIANFDWPFPGLRNTTVDLPGTLSVIDISSMKK